MVPLLPRVDDVRLHYVISDVTKVLVHDSFVEKIIMVIRSHIPRSHIPRPHFVRSQFFARWTPTRAFAGNWWIADRGNGEVAARGKSTSNVVVVCVVVVVVIAIKVRLWCPSQVHPGEVVEGSL